METDADDRIASAADEIEEFLLEMHEDEDGVHANTLVCTSAAIAGEALLRVTMNEGDLYGRRGALASGSQDALAAGIGGGSVLDHLEQAAQTMGLGEEDFPDIIEIRRLIAAGIDNGEAPVLTADSEQEPEIPPMIGAALAREDVLDIYTAYDLDARAAAQAATLALCRVISESSEVLAPAIAFRLALGSLVTATLLYPVARDDIEQITGTEA